MLLRPDEDVNQIYLYCLAEAAERYEISLHGFVAMSNHQHVVFRDNLGNFPEFIGHLDRMLAKAMNARLKRSENFWATGQANVVYLVEAHDRFAKLLYLLANPVADHLVDRVSDWPGACSFSLNLSGRTRTIERPRSFFRASGKMPRQVVLRLERLEGFEELSDEAWSEMLLSAVEAKEKRARDERAGSGTSVFGRKAVLRVSPTETPKNSAPRGRLHPHLACKNKERRQHELRALVEFRFERCSALACMQSGELEVLFPFGTYRIWGFFRTHSPPALKIAA